MLLNLASPFINSPLSIRLSHMVRYSCLSHGYDAQTQIHPTLFNTPLLSLASVKRPRCLHITWLHQTPRMVPSMPDFVLVVDEEKLSLIEWHAENQKLNPSHYGCSRVLSAARCAQIHKSPPAAFIAPLSILEFPSADYGAIQRVVKPCIHTHTCIHTYMHLEHCI